MTGDDRGDSVQTMLDPRGGSPAFPLTRWTLVQRAGEAGCSVAREELCRLYWYPLYVWARSKGHGPEDAEDLTQGFFQRLLEGRMLALADQERGRMRSFLLKAFAYDLIDERRRQGRQKRGGGAVMIPLDLELAERLWVIDREAGPPAQAFERAWVNTVFRTALESVRQRYVARAQEGLFEALRPWLDGSEHEADVSVMAETAGLNAGAARQAIHRIRERFRLAVRATIADTLESPDEAAIEAEFAAFAEILTRSQSGN